MDQTRAACIVSEQTLNVLVGEVDVDDVQTRCSCVIRHAVDAAAALCTLYVGLTGALYRQTQSTHTYSHTQTHNSLCHHQTDRQTRPDSLTDYGAI